MSVDLDGLGLIPVGAPATFTIMVAGGDDAELAVSVQGRIIKKDGVDGLTDLVHLYRGSAKRLWPGWVNAAGKLRQKW